MTPNISAEALAHIRKETLDLYNRLHSIEEDISFVDNVRQAYPSQAFLPNLRCGAWYTDPTYSRNTPAYFKSTDGHYGNWSFNLRRPNLHLINVAVEHRGLILVDSTRAGKRIPDALSKTLPIWCSVINRAVLLRQQTHACTRSPPWNTALYTPPAVVSVQEHKQIESRLDEWAENLASSSYDLPDLPAPLRPLWISPATSTFPFLPPSDRPLSDSSFIPIICVSASKQVHEGIDRRSLGFAYIQGSGDDHELWGMGLTPELFWQNRGKILSQDRESLETFVSNLVSGSSSSMRNALGANLPTPIVKASSRLLLTSLSDLPTTLPSPTMRDDTPRQLAFLLITPSEDHKIPDRPPTQLSRELTSAEFPPVLTIGLTPGKKGQHQLLKTVLPQAESFVGFHLKRGSNVCIACETGKDASVGVALGMLQRFFDDQGNYTDGPGNSREAVEVTKQSIRTRLQWIISSRPQANPSRATLKRVNEFLLSPEFVATDPLSVEGSLSRA